jgi:hypothetical protein
MDGGLNGAHRNPPEPLPEIHLLSASAADV